MAKPKGTHFVISAGFTASGAPAYLTSEGRWSTQLQEAEAIATAEERDQKLRAVMKQEAEVCDPFVFEVCLEGTTIDPLSARESIRALGPTTPIRRPD